MDGIALARDAARAIAVSFVRASWPCFLDCDCSSKNAAPAAPARPGSATVAEGLLVRRAVGIGALGLYWLIDRVAHATTPAGGRGSPC